MNFDLGFVRRGIRKLLKKEKKKSNKKSPRKSQPKMTVGPAGGRLRTN